MWFIFLINILLKQIEFLHILKELTKVEFSIRKVWDCGVLIGTRLRLLSVGLLSIAEPLYLSWRLFGTILQGCSYESLKALTMGSEKP